MSLAKPYPASEYCTHISESGRRCSALKMLTREVCIGHWKQDGEFVDDDEALAQLASRWSGMSTSRGVNRALALLFNLTASGKISHRRASLLTYQAQMMLYGFSLSRGESTSHAAHTDAVQTDPEASSPLAPSPFTQRDAQRTEGPPLAPEVRAALSHTVVEAMEEVMEPVGHGIKSAPGSNGSHG